MKVIRTITLAASVLGAISVATPSFGAAGYAAGYVADKAKQGIISTIAENKLATASFAVAAACHTVPTLPCVKRVIPTQVKQACYVVKFVAGIYGLRRYMNSESDKHAKAVKDLAVQQAALLAALEKRMKDNFEAARLLVIEKAGEARLLAERNAQEAREAEAKAEADREKLAREQKAALEAAKGEVLEAQNGHARDIQAEQKALGLQMNDNQALNQQALREFGNLLLQVHQGQQNGQARLEAKIDGVPEAVVKQIMIAMQAQPAISVGQSQRQISYVESADQAISHLANLDK
ncbi:MAG TPA: hypothetical protein VGT41_01910 [Candidatus Babeliales bacterium]|nr:hypothetical protein [Candidatus Babeliales bacterium]